MRQLRIGGLVSAMLALLVAVCGCGSMRASSALGDPHAGPTQGAAAHGNPRWGASAQAAHGTPTPGASERAGPAGTPAGLTASQVIWDKEHGIVPRGQGGTTVVKHADMLNGVSCAGGQCVAVGAYYYGQPERTLAELWTGTAWRLQASPDGRLAAVSCAAPGRCLAVGAPVLAESGGRWRVVAGTSDMGAVSCAGTGAGGCVAVGSAQGTPVFATWDGRSWHTGTMRMPPSPAYDVNVFGVSCAAADNCVAVGGYSNEMAARPNPDLRNETLAEQWDGRAWRVLPAVNVSHDNGLTAVSCAAPDDCTAVGENASAPLAEHWDGQTWRVERVPTVSSVGNLELTGVSCPAAGWCVAAGTYQAQPVAATWDGRRWRLTLLPQPQPGSDYVQVSGISCADTRVCVTVGDDVAGTFADLYEAGTWQVTGTRNPL